MNSIRRMLLAWLLAGLAAIALSASGATYLAARREVGELLDLQLKQLAYSTRIDDLLRGRRPGFDRARGSTRRGHYRARHADLGSRRRARLLVATGHGAAGARDRRVFDGQPGRPRLARLHARAGHACAAGRAGAGRARGDRDADGAAHAGAVPRADPDLRRADLARRRTRPASARRDVARGGEAASRCDGAARRTRPAPRSCSRWRAA